MAAITEWCKKLLDPPNLITILLFSATVAVFCATRQLAEASRDQLTLSYPPQLRITNVVIFKKGRTKGEIPEIVPASEIDGVAYAVNTRREHAIVKSVICATHWQRGKLPMWRPYNDLKMSGGDPQIGGNCAAMFPPKVATGQFVEWRYSTKVPKDYTPDMFLYVMGNIEFYDRLGTRHITLFARKYDPGLSRFVAEKDNPDYESVE
jgi:hypothetical protein